MCVFHCCSSKLAQLACCQHTTNTQMLPRLALASGICVRPGPEETWWLTSPTGKGRISKQPTAVRRSNQPPLIQQQNERFSSSAARGTTPLWTRTKHEREKASERGERKEKSHMTTEQMSSLKVKVGLFLSSRVQKPALFFSSWRGAAREWWRNCPLRASSC